MADKETDDTLEEIPSEQDSSNVASKGLSKPILIKIAIGLILLLLIAGAAYFFFMSADEAAPKEAAVEIGEEIIPSELTPPISTSESVETEIESPNTIETELVSKDYTAEDIRILKMREEAVALKEENLQMKERLSKLEGQQTPNIETTEPTVEVTTPEEAAKVSEAVSKPKVKTNPYADLYSRDYTLAREPQREPPPEPKWGNFDPLYRGQ